MFLRQSNNGLFFIGHPSAGGRYVVGTSHLPPLVNAGDQLYLWDISSANGRWYMWHLGRMAFMIPIIS